MNEAVKPEPRGLKGLWLITLGLGVLAAGGLIWHFYFRTPADPIREETKKDLPAPDPRLSYQGPFKNIHPDVAYVSESECARCHKGHAKTFAQHPMARTLASIEQASLRFDPKMHKPFEAFGQQFHVEYRDGKTIHVRSALDQAGKALFRHELEVKYVIGSGVRAHSYLAVRGATVLHSPITWYAQKKVWDLSPGFVVPFLAGRRVGGDCLYCHSNGASEDPKNDTAYGDPIFPNGYGIGCQRCHGPGAEHVKEPGKMIQTELGKLDPTIVNPAHLTPHLRDSICWQCHLEGTVRILRRGRQRFDFRPGLPLEDFIGVFDDVAETAFDHVVNHVEQMLQSRCYKESAGSKKMGCVSCHDPHEVPGPKERVEFFRASCLACHENKGCSVPVAKRLIEQKDDSCIACHMPQFGTADATHVSSTDHRVPRKPLPHKPDTTPNLKKPPVRDFVSVFAQHRNKADAELERDRALASGMLARNQRPMQKPLYKEFEAAIQRDPGDLAVKTQYGLERINRGEVEKGLTLLQEVLAREPNNENALVGRAIACTMLSRKAEALADWRRLVAMAPTQWGYRLGLGEQLMNERLFTEAAEAARDWIAFDPGAPHARALLRDSLSALGKTSEAQEEQRILNELNKRMAKP
jgi:Flp pilus assembly protein TadD